MEEGVEDEGRMQRREAVLCTVAGPPYSRSPGGEGGHCSCYFLHGWCPQEVFITVTLVEKEQEVVH